MVQQSFLHPIIDAAARLGEEVLCARAAQDAFERRSVHKFVFAVAPINSYAAPARRPGVTSARHSDAGSVNCGAASATHCESGFRGLAVVPELGQVVSVAGKSTLVCHRETLSLPYLRRSFLRIGRSAAWGEVRIKIGQG